MQEYAIQLIKQKKMNSNSLKYTTMKKTMLIMVLLVAGITMNAQNTEKIDSVKILTSIQCDMCEERVGELLSFEKGVKHFNIDLDTKYVSVIYNPKKTTPAEIKKAISGVGYDADDVAADKEAYAKLPACCKKPEDHDHKSHEGH